jgi:hypothetical protein
MLAATVAFSPVVSTSTLFQPAEVKAATTVNVNTEIDQLAERFFIFYKDAGTFGFPATTPAAVSNLTYSQITTAASTGGISLAVPAGKETAFLNLMKNTATLIYTKYATKEDLAAAVKAFKANNAAIFNNLFEENGDIFAEQLVLFVKDLEGKLEGAIVDVMASNNPTYANVIKTAVNNTFQSGPNRAHYANLDGKLGKVGLSVEGLFLLQEKLNNDYIDTNKNLRSAMMQSAFKAKNAQITSTGNAYGLSVQINGSFDVVLRGSVQWATSNPAVATFNGNTLVPVSTGTVEVYAMLDGIKLATKSNVSVTVTSPGGGDNGGGGTQPGDDIFKPNPGNPGGVVLPPENVEKAVDKITPTNKAIDVPLPPGNGGQANLPGSLFTGATAKDSEAVISIKSDNASYNLPASQINVANLATQLGVSADKVQINVVVKVTEATEIKNGVKVVSKVVEFTVEAVSDGKSVPVTTFSTYVERSITGDNNFDPNKSTAVKVNSDGTLVPVPTLFAGKDANFKSLTNSKYTVIENNFTFPDVDNKKNWAEEYIEPLANKLIITGKPDGKYAPAEEMTRAQFTVLLVRALGLPGGKYEQKFSDVKESDWFNLNGELAVAVEKGIIQGKPDGRFAPNESITRTQAAAMLHRAMKLDFIKYDTKQLDKTKVITDFKDAGKIQDWAKPSIEAIYQAGIMSGKPDSTFDPNGKTKRDQMAKMLGEFLISAKLMNKIK